MVQMLRGRLEIYSVTLALSVASSGPCTAAVLIEQIRPYQDGANLLIVLARA